MGFYPFPGGRQPLSQSPMRWLTICLSPHFALLSRFSVYFMCLPLWLVLYFDLWHITTCVPYNRHDRKYLLPELTVIYEHLLLNGGGMALQPAHFYFTRGRNDKPLLWVVLFLPEVVHCDSIVF